MMRMHTRRMKRKGEASVNKDPRKVDPLFPHANSIVARRFRFRHGEPISKSPTFQQVPTRFYGNLAMFEPAIPRLPIRVRRGVDEKEMVVFHLPDSLAELDSLLSSGLQKILHIIDVGPFTPALFCFFASFLAQSPCHFRLEAGVRLVCKLGKLHRFAHDDLLLDRVSRGEKLVTDCFRSTAEPVVVVHALGGKSPVGR
jgi:hypothetical protein